MKKISGLSGAAGCVMGTAVVMKDETVDIDKKNITNVNSEVNKLNSAKERYLNSLDVLYEKAMNEVGEEGAGIFEAYKEILSDDVFFGKVIDRIEKDMVNVEYAINEEKKEVVEMFESLDDEYLKERATDISNVCMELTKEIQGKKQDNVISNFNGMNLIVIADDLTPADTIKLDKNVLKGFITQKGGITSHTVILAKTLGIPAIVGLEGVLDKIKDGETIIMYGDDGDVIIDPDESKVKEFEKINEENEVQSKLFEKSKREPAVTLDGRTMRVNINSGDVESIASLNSDDCDGVGLFRTEFLYMNHNNYPTEEEQFKVYREIAEKANGKEVIIRTLDIGGDKQIDYMDLPKEDNPFLGYRAIRLCLDRVEIFKTQLKAILRASIFGDIKIMFPMIVNLEELLKAKEILEEVKNQLDELNIDYNKEISVGIMIETPAAVLLSDQLAQEVNFFSIGSNDLIQYTTATDRMNNRIQWLYDSCNISVLRSIKMVCDNAKKHGVEVGICGEVASESRLVPMWVAMGVDELSVVPSQVGKVKYIINQVSFNELQDELNKILNLGKIEDVKTKLSQIEEKILN